MAFPCNVSAERDAPSFQFLTRQAGRYARSPHLLPGSSLFLFELQSKRWELEYASCRKDFGSRGLPLSLVTARSQHFEDAVNRAIGLSMADANRDNAIDPVVHRG